MPTQVQESNCRLDKLISFPGQSTHRKARPLGPQDRRGETADRVSEVFTSQPSVWWGGGAIEKASET